MDDGSSGGRKSDTGKSVAHNKKTPPPLHRIQQQQQQRQSPPSIQQYQQKYLHHFGPRQYPAAAAIAAGASATSSILANSAPPFPPKLQHPLSASSNASAMTAATPYVETDRSDSGLSSSRTLNSGDERSGSHSSAFSGSDDHAAATSPLNDQHATQPFNNAPVWRDPNMIQTIDGPIRHVESVQHQSLFISNTQVPQALPFQPFHTPTVLPPSPMQPIRAGGMLWKPQAIANNNTTANYYHHSDEQHKLNRGNTENDFYKEIKRIKPPSYVQSTNVGKRSEGGSIENNSTEYGQVEIERMVNINRHQRGGNREHVEKQQAEAAVHQHFEESLKLAQQQGRTNWISNLTIPPKNTFPNQGPKIQEISKQKIPLQTTNNRGVDEWKDKNNRYAPPRMTPIESSSRPSTQQMNYKTRAVPKLNYDRENVLNSGNEGGNHISNMISYTPYVMNSNHTYAFSNSSVIVKHESSYKNPTISTSENYENSRAPTILSVPAINLDCNVESKHAKFIQYSRSAPPANSSQIKTPDISQEPHHPGPSLNTHGRYALYPPMTVTTQRDLESPPPAHFNATVTSVLPKFIPVAVSVDDLQTEPLDLVVMCNSHTSNSDAPETDVPLQLYSNKNNATPDPQEITNKCDIKVCDKDKLDSLEMSSPNDIINSSLNPLTSKSMVVSPTLSVNNLVSMQSIISTQNLSTSSKYISSDNLGNNSMITPTTSSSTILVTNLINTPSLSSETMSSTASTEIKITTIGSISTSVTTTSSSVISATTSLTSSTTNMTNDSSPPTPPPILMTAPYTDTTYGLKTHHHKLKKAWLQRHTWAEDLKEAGFNIDQNPPSSFSQIDDTPPILQCEVTKKRKKSKSGSDNVHVNMPPDISPNNSEAEQVLTNGTKKSKKRKVFNSTINSETKSTTESDKDSDFVVEKKIPPIKIPKKRGRKPKVVVSIPLKKGKNDESEGHFFQSGPCLNAGPKIHKCRECRLFINKRKKDITTQDDIDNIFCRFYAFRRLFTNKQGQSINAGFPDPYRDVTVEDLNLWMPNSNFPPSSLDVEVAKKVLIEAGRQFCYLVKEENKALSLSPYSHNKPIAWKKAANGIREMCDVCLTTIFNYHWACAKCGFGVCIDCVKARLNGTAEAPNAATMTKKDLREKDTFLWMTCNSKHNHDVERLMLTQIVAGDSMNMVLTKLHEICSLWNIAIECGCPDHPFPELQNDTDDSNDENELSKEKNIPLAENSTVNTNEVLKNSSTDSLKKSPADSLNQSLADNSKSTDNLKTSTSDCSQINSSDDSKYSSTDDTMINSTKNSESNSVSNSNSNEPQCSTDNKNEVTLDSEKKETMKHFIRKKNKYMKTIPRQPLPPRVMTLAESRESFPDNPHTWLCDGKLLRLLDPENPTNCDIFQEQWKRGQPVMVSDVGKSLDPNLWSPSSFSRDFGKYTNDLIDCATGMLVEGKTMKQFWDGFEDESKRLKDSNGKKMLLKLKDWPVTADFSETLPDRFEDFMHALPLKEYTQRDGKLNLASRLPACFVRPDLGPKMYSAYGNAGNREPGQQLLGTTNLHLDVSDAVNVMVFVAVSRKDDNSNSEDETDHDWHVKEAYRVIDEAGCDIVSRRRAREPKELPGAVWHIYHARDADSIRDLLNKVSAERGEPLEPNHDPIHDQSSYLDADLRARLFNEYGVQGYAVLQCLGDAIFIPAGAPHQVRNLHNCIKVAEDFVSPENVSQCFRLMKEFRDLSSNHSNHEDKLQIKNIMYHAIKDSLSVLLHEGIKKEL